MRYLFLLIFTIPSLAQELSPYDMNGDGYVNVQDIDNFIQALHDGSRYITVQDINPFLEQIKSAKPNLELYIPSGMSFYMDTSIPFQEGLNPELDYILCREVQIYDGIKYIPHVDGRLESLDDICLRLGLDPSTVTVIIFPK